MTPPVPFPRTTKAITGDSGNEMEGMLFPAPRIQVNRRAQDDEAKESNLLPNSVHLRQTPGSGPYSYQY